MPRKHRGARWHAGGVLTEGAFEKDAFFGKTVKMRRLDIWVFKEAETASVHLIDLDEYDVWLFHG